MGYVAANNAASTLAAGINSSVTTLSIQTADVSKFPVINHGGSGSDYTYLTLQDSANNIEIVKVTRHDSASASMTVVRGQDGTTARAWSSGDAAALRLNAGVVTDAFARAYAAEVSETNAAASAAAAAASYDSFDDRYLGAKSTAPTTDNDGNALLTGALYFDTSSNLMKTYTGSAWISAYAPSVSASGVAFTPSGGVSATNLQSAIQELDSEKQAYDANLTSLSNGGLFKKADSTIVAWSKTGAGTATTSQTLYIEVNGSIKTIASGASITMPTLTAGTDYAIWAKTDGTLEATSNHTSPPTANARKVGGFHYAAGGNATGTSGGDSTPAINAYSFWDVKWRPVCTDPRGMTLVGGGYWMDIYLTGVDAITNGSSKYNVTMADGSSPPKVPTMFGGNGSTTYGSYTWFEAMELSAAFGKRCPTQREFMSAMYGTTEASSVGTDQNNTILNAAYTSKWGVMQSTGVLWIWGDDRGGAYNTSGWNANTEGRGSEYNAPNAVLLGGSWGDGSVSGSRCSNWGVAASASSGSIGSRFCCDHLQLD